VHFLGYRRDIEKLLKNADVFVFPSYREGLPVSLMEAMASGIPMVASKVRGNVDLIEDGVNGFLCDPDDAEDFAKKISLVLNDNQLTERFSEENKERIKKFEQKAIVEEIRKIYMDVADSAVEHS
jgi:glycosyltransferase EpsD